MAKRKKNRSSLQRILILTIVLSLGAGYLVFKNFTSNQTVEITKIDEEIPAGFKARGIDISHHQSKINWEQFFAEKDSSIQFVYCKVTEGTSFIDNKWNYNRSELQKYKISHGAYHFFLPHLDPLTQAKHFLTHYRYRKNDLPPVLDVETETGNDSELIKNMKIWLDFIENETGEQPIIYTSYHFYKTKFKTKFSNHKFWVANYANKPERFKDDRIIYWQYSESGEVPGISGKVDLNYSKSIIQ